MLHGLLNGWSRRLCFAAASLSLAGAAVAFAHPGSGIVTDRSRNLYFNDTGEGVWQFGTHPKPRLISAQAYHWLAIDEKGHFANSESLGEFDGGTFSRITPAGTVPALVVSSDYPGHHRRGWRALLRPIPPEAPARVDPPHAGRNAIGVCNASRRGRCKTGGLGEWNCHWS
jgi:hypothetical protein